MNSVEGLTIYKQYMELIYYMEKIVEKYPRNLRYSLVDRIKQTTYDGMENIIKANKYHDRYRLIELNELDVKLKMMKVLVRVSYKNKYINKQNYGAWSRKITNINNLMLGWIKSCLKQ